MKKYSLDNFTRGWIVGDFEPSIIRSKDFEIMVRFYPKGFTEADHVHKVADEITVITGGEFKMNGINLSPGDIIHLEPGDPVKGFECLKDGATTVVKRPSVQGDKYLL